MNGECNNQSKMVVVAVVALVIAAVFWMNFVTRVANEDGSPIFRTNYKSPPKRLARSNGWPNPIWVRTNWATIQNGSYKFDDQMRPRESSFDISGLVKNITVLASLVAITFLVVPAIYQRQFSLRKLMLFAFIAAVLVLLLRPYVRTEMERRHQVREFEQWATQYGY